MSPRLVVAALLVLLANSNAANTRKLLQLPVITGIGSCPDAPGDGPTLVDNMTPALATLRANHDAGPVQSDPELYARAVSYMQSQKVCANSNNPAPTYNTTEGLVGVGYAAIGNPVAKAYKCLQGINQWYTASTGFAFNSATPYTANALPGDLQRTSDALGMVAMLWNSTEAYGCAMAVCSDNFHTEMFCFFRDPTGALPLLLENQRPIDRGDNTLRAEMNSIVSMNVAPAQAPCPSPYVTQTGDTLDTIAKRFNVSAAELTCFNRQMGATVQIGLGNIPLLIPCPGMAPTSCPEWDFISGIAPTTMMQTPMDDFSTAAARFNYTANDVCCYNVYYNLTKPAGGACGAPPLFNGTTSYFMVPSKQELLDRNCNDTKTVQDQKPGVPIECPDKAATLNGMNEFRRRFMLTDIKWQDSLVAQAKQLAGNADVCKGPFDSRVSVSIGAAYYSGAARPHCANTISAYWGIFEQASKFLQLWDMPDQFVDQTPAGLQVVTRFFPKNTTTGMGCVLSFCNPYWTWTSCVFAANGSTTTTNNTIAASSAGRRLFASLDGGELFDISPETVMRGRALAARPPVPQVTPPPTAADCPFATIPTMGDTLESFAAQYNSTPKEITCYLNQLRNINNEFNSFWMLGTVLAIPCPNSMAANASCPEWDLQQGKCDIPYLVYPGDSPASVAALANRLSKQNLNITAAELCCYNQGMGSVVNKTCGFNTIGVNITIPCPSSLAAAGCTSSAITKALSASSGESSSSDLAVILGCAIGIPLGLALIGLLAFFIYRRHKASTSSRGSTGRLSDPLAKSVDFDDDLTKGKYDLETSANQETTNSIVMYGKQRTGAMSGVVLKFFKNEDAFRHERLFYTDYSNPQFFPECYDARPMCKQHLPCIVMERGDTSLRQWIKQGGNSNAGARTKAHVKAILADIGDGLKSLHGRGIVHGDVKPENVLFFTRSHRWKLIDFGTWSKVDESLIPSYSLRYSAPEVVTAATNGKAMPSKPAQDMWSLGMVMWECLVGEHMLAEYKDSQVTAMLTGQSPMPFEDDPSLWQVIKEEPARRLLHALLQRKPNFRWDVNRVMENAFFREGEDTVMTYRKFQALNETQGAVLNKLDEVANKVSTLQPFPVEKLTEQPQSAIMICCTLEELSDSDSSLLFDSDAALPNDGTHTQQGKESAGEHYKLQEKHPMVRLRKLVNDGIISGREVPIVDTAGPEAASLAPDNQIFMLKKGKKYLVKMKLAMCDSAVLSVQTVASMSITPVSQPSDSVMVPMHALDSACSPTQLVAFGLWDPSEHSSNAFSVMGTTIAVEAALCMYTKTADIPIVVKPIAMVMMNNNQAEVVAHLPTHNQGMQDRWDSAPQWVKAAAVGVQWFYQL